MERAAGGSTNDAAGRGRRWLAERLTPAQMKALALFVNEAAAREI